MVFILVSSCSEKKCQLSSHNGPISNRFFFWSTIVTAKTLFMGTLADHSLLTWFYITNEKNYRLFWANRGTLRERVKVQGWGDITSQLHQTGQFKAEDVENDLRCSPCSSSWRRDASLGRRRSGRRRLGTGSCRPPPSSWSENLTNDKLEIWTNFRMSTVDVMQRLDFVEAEECFGVHTIQS